MAKIDIDKLEKSLGVNFSDKGLLLKALTHSSYSNENQTKENYERFEFLGDAVLQLVITEYLLNKYKDYDEGLLSKVRGYFVSEDFLAEAARSIKLGHFVILGKGEIAGNGRERDSLLCDVFESVIAAVYTDMGYEVTKKLALKLLEPRIDSAMKKRRYVDAKSELQILFQRRYGTLPDYRVVSQSGPEHNKTFTVELYLDGEVIAVGKGSSKKVAEKKAAGIAMEKLK